MARLLIGSSLRHIAERWPVIHRFIWVVESFLFGCFLVLAWLMPLSWAQAIASRGMGFLGPRQFKHRRVQRNLELAFPDSSPSEREAMGRALWGNIGKVFAEYAHLARLNRNFAKSIEVVGGEHLTRLSAAGQAAVLVSPHLGNWEISGCAMAQMGLEVSAVYTPLQNPYLDRIIARCRRAGHGSGLLARDESMRAMLREIAQGRSVGLIMDQRVDSGSPVPFFGIDKLTSLIPARLAVRHGIDLIPVRTERLAHGRFRVTFLPPVEAPSDVVGDVQKAIAMTTTVNEYFEDWIRAVPEDWFITQRLWAKDAEPAATASLAVPDSGRA
ncbi:MAG: lysophospholipid acyltransferase family protein [Gammaproteobacteria bacterium]